MKGALSTKALILHHEAVKRRELGLVLLLVLVQGGLLFGIALDKAETFDEPVYLFRSSWIFASFPSPPAFWLTPQWAFASALWIADPAGDHGRLDLGPGLTVLARTHPESWRRLLCTARFSTIVVTLAAGLWLWRAARRFGVACGLAAHALWVFSPTVLAHGGLVNMDAWAAAWSALLLLCGVRFVEQPSWARAAEAGIPLALAASTKSPALAGAAPLVLVMAWAILRQDPRGKDRSLALLQTATALGATFVLALWALYAFSVGPVRRVALRPTGLADHGSTMGSLPFPVFIEALLTQSTYGAQGKTSYLFGEVKKTGWWWYYLAVLGLKVTVSAQILFAARFYLLWRAPRAERRIDWALLLAPCLLLLVLSFARAQGGVRYLLPAFPFALVFLARGLPEAEKRFGRRGSVAYALVLLLGVLESLSVYPHALMFFNVWAGGPASGPRYLVHGDDWGQDKRRLGQWQEDNAVPMLYYARNGGNPELWGIRSEPVPCVPRKGVFALHAEEVHRHGFVAAGCLDWLTLEPPDDRLGYSIYLYVVDKERLRRLRSTCATPRPFWRSGEGPPCDRFKEKDEGS